MKKSIASFLMVLILTIPFYLSSVFAQNEPFETSGLSDPAQSCVAKAEEGRDLVETLDSGPIKTLEGIVSTLHFTCTAWATTEAFFNAYVQVTGALEICPSQNYPLCAANAQEIMNKIPGNKFFTSICSLAECRYAEAAGSELLKGSETFRSVVEKTSTVQGITSSIEIGGLSSGVGPFDNIYTSIAQLCPAGILYNLRKLKTIYQTHSCCIQKACSTGASTESCDRQLSEATCMYWEGSLALSAIKILLGFAGTFITNQIADEIQKIVEETGVGSYLGAVLSLFRAYNHIQSLQDSFEWMSRTFSEPNCNDLDFDDIIDNAEESSLSLRKCEFVEFDDNKDGLIERLVCV